MLRLTLMLCVSGPLVLLLTLTLCVNGHLCPISAWHISFKLNKILKRFTCSSIAVTALAKEGTMGMKQCLALKVRKSSMCLEAASASASVSPLSPRL